MAEAERVFGSLPHAPRVEDYNVLIHGCANASRRGTAA